MSNSRKKNERAELARRFEDIHGLWAKALHGFLMSRLMDREKTDEVLQEVFSKLYEVMLRGDEIRSPQAYLFQAAKNRALDLLRAKTKDEKIQLAAHSRHLLRQKEGADLSLEDEEKRKISEALHQLPEEQREVIVLKIFHGLTFEEIGDALNTPMKTASSRYQYGLDKLKSMLSGMFENEI